MGLGFLGFTIYQNEAKVDSEGLLFFLLSIMFSSAAVSFNRASTYAGFLSNPAKPAAGERESIQFSKLLKRTHAEIIGSQFLVEVDVNAPYEKTVIDFCLESLSNGERVFVATPKSSVLHRALANYGGIRFCLFSSNVSRPTPVEKEEGQILIPQDTLDGYHRCSGNGVEAIERRHKICARFGQSVRQSHFNRTGKNVQVYEGNTFNSG